MKPVFFGPGLWHAMLVCAYWAKASDVRGIMEMFDRIGLLLPCVLCRQHYAAYRRKKRVAPNSRDALFRWVYDLKHDVNRRLGQQSPPFEDVAARLDLSEGRCDDVLIADTLFMLAYAVRSLPDETRTLLTVCGDLAAYLPLPRDSELRKRLADAATYLDADQVPIIRIARELCAETRREHKLPAVNARRVRQFSEG